MAVIGEQQGVDSGQRVIVQRNIASAAPPDDADLPNGPEDTAARKMFQGNDVRRGIEPEGLRIDGLGVFGFLDLELERPRPYGQHVAAGNPLAKQLQSVQFTSVFGNQVDGNDLLTSLYERQVDRIDPAVLKNDLAT
jgi:hypothetical protein